MIAVIFEVTPADGQGAARYFELAGELKDVLARQDGFISVERFESLAQPGRYLSLSFWRDEVAVRNWRCHAMHRSAQLEGRQGVLAAYRLRVASVVRDYGLIDRDQAPSQESADARDADDAVG